LTEKRKYEIDRNFASEIKRRYSPAPKDETEKIFDNLQTFFSYAQEPGRPLQSILDQAVRLIYRLFNLKEVSIAIKSEKDGLYRYVSLLGLRKDAEEAHRRIAYTYEEIWDTDKYPSIKLSRFSEFDIEDGTTLEGDELLAYNRPILLTQERKSYDEPLESDYFTVYIFGYKEELLGWIEIGDPRSGKLPERSTIKWIELICSTLGLIIQREKPKMGK